MKRIGATSEAQFVAKALSKGFQVCQPRGDFAAYDFIIETKTGKLLKIQVKATNTKQDNTYKLYVKKGRKGEDYEVNAFDFLVVHIYKLDTWYLIPKSKLSGRTPRMSGRGKGQGQYEEFFEAWGLLEDE